MIPQLHASDMETILEVDGKGSVHCIDVMLIAAHRLWQGTESWSTADSGDIIIQWFPRRKKGKHNDKGKLINFSILETISQKT